MEKLERFWTMKRRSYLYSVALSLVPVLVAVGFLTGDVAQLVLNVIAAALAVGSGSMALANLTPDDTIKVMLSLSTKEDEQNG
jgi:predicted Kef-type K+ transport protein